MSEAIQQASENLEMDEIDLDIELQDGFDYLSLLPECDRKVITMSCFFFFFFPVCCFTVIYAKCNIYFSLQILPLFEENFLCVFICCY